MSQTRLVEISIQAVSPESILTSALDEAAGLVGSGSASARTSGPVRNSAEATNGASRECFTENLHRPSSTAPQAQQHRGEGLSTNGHLSEQLMCRMKSTLAQVLQLLIW